MLRLILRIFLAAGFLLAGIIHLRSPRLFLPIMPPLIPLPMACIFISGLCEILGGLGLLMPLAGLRTLTGWALVLLLIAIFPANVYMASADVRIHGFPSQRWMSWARLPLQAVLILAVEWSTSIWPFSLARR